MLSALFENRYTSGLSSSLTGVSTASFAEEVSKRAGENLGISANTPNTPEATNEAASSEKSGQLDALRESLASTLSWAGSRYGDEAAQAMMGVMAASLGNGEITEDSLGQALLEAVRFVDGAFGFEEGDAFMEHLNGSLNDSLNALFDNGANEQFFAVNSDGSVSGVSGQAGLDLEAVLEDVTNSILETLAEARAQAKNSANGLAYGQSRQDTGKLIDIQA